MVQQTNAHGIVESSMLKNFSVEITSLTTDSYDA